MVTAAQKAEFTKWFKPENYVVLKDITVMQLCQEIRLRKAMFEELEEAFESDDPEWCVSQANLRELELILTGNPLLATQNELTSTQPYESDPHVKVMTAGKLYMFESRVREAEIVKYQENAPERVEIHDQIALRLPVVECVKKCVQKRIEKVTFSDEKKKSLMRRAGGVIPLVIEIDNSTDEQIIESMRYLLNQWRKNTGIRPKTSQQSYGFGEVINVFVALLNKSNFWSQSGSDHPIPAPSGGIPWQSKSLKSPTGTPTTRPLSTVAPSLSGLMSRPSRPGTTNPKRLHEGVHNVILR